MEVGWNVFQYKARGISGGGRKKSVSELKSNLNGALADLVARLKVSRVAKRYTLFMNLQLGLVTETKTAKGAALSKERKEITASIRKGDQCGATIDVVDASQLAALVNKHPALRLTFFTPQSLALGARSWMKNKRQRTTKFRFR